MKRFLSINLAILALACMGYSCTTATKVSSIDEIQSKWTVSSIDGEAVSKEAFVMFQGSIIAGNSGCNNFTGAASFASDSLHVGNLVGTRKMCPDMEFENKMQGMLNNSTWSLSLSDATLTMTNEISSIELTKVETETSTEE